MDAPTERVPQSKREPISLRFSSRWARASDSSAILQQQSNSHRHTRMCLNVAKCQCAARQRVNARTRPSTGPPSCLLVAAVTTLATQDTHMQGTRPVSFACRQPLRHPALHFPGNSAPSAPIVPIHPTLGTRKRSRTPQRTSASQSGHTAEEESLSPLLRRHPRRRDSSHGTTQGEPE